MTSSASILPASLQNNLQQIVERANTSGASIRAILLSTTEGVPLGRVYANQPLNEDVLASIESVWAPASKQFPVLGLEKVHQVTAIYDHGVLMHVYLGPMVRLFRSSDWSVWMSSYSFSLSFVCIVISLLVSDIGIT
jgi:hypothetical protein